MEYQNMTNLLDNTTKQPSKCTTKNQQQQTQMTEKIQ